MLVGKIDIRRIYYGLCLSHACTYTAWIWERMAASPSSFPGRNGNALDFLCLLWITSAACAALWPGLRVLRIVYASSYAWMILVFGDFLESFQLWEFVSLLFAVGFLFESQRWLVFFKTAGKYWINAVVAAAVAAIHLLGLYSVDDVVFYVLLPLILIGPAL